MISVLAANYHPVVRLGLRTILSAESDIVLVGEAVDCHQARQMCLELDPDVLLLGIHFDDASSMETLAFVHVHSPGTKVLGLGISSNPEDVQRLVAARVGGYLLESESPETVVRAVRAVAQGGTWFSGAVIEKLVRWQVERPPPSRHPDLTERELAVLQSVVVGKTDREIARELDVAERTVRNCLQNIYSKLGVNTRIEAATRAVRLQLFAD